MALYHACMGQKLEGIVAKKSDSKYRHGQRTKDWDKVKFTENGVFTVVGYQNDDGFLVAEQRGRELVPVGFVQYGFSDTSYRKMVASLKTVNHGSSDKVIRYNPAVKVNVEFMTRTKKGS